jgi:spermidine synthase
LTDAITASPPAGPAPSEPRDFTTGHRWLIHAIFLISGAVSLVYQVLWMRRLGLLFGNTAQATATTLAAFFLGLALGGWAAGQLATRLRHPLRAYGWVEIGVAAGAMLYFGLIRAYGALYPPLFRTLGHQAGLFLMLKLVLGVLVLLPAASLIGATLPLVGQHLLRRPEVLGSGGTLLYAVNTIGAAIGAYLAGFILPLALGFRGTYLLAVACNVALGLVVLAASYRVPEPAPGRPPARAAPAGPPGFPSWPRIKALAFVTGLVTLALEVLWTHMFAQVLHNSVYTFAIILIAFLGALALGSLLAHDLIRARRNPQSTLVGLLAVGSALVWLSPWLFYRLTGGLRYVAENQGWLGYQVVVFALAAVVIVPATLLLGTVFPYLLKLSEAHSRGAGHTLGQLVAINTVAAILGSLLAGFVLLGAVGLWSAVRIVGLLGLVGIPVAAARRAQPGVVLRWGAAMAVLLVATVASRGHPAVLRLDPGQEEQLVQLWEGSSGVVAVVRNSSGLIIKVNNHYTLGGSGSLENERRQGLLPLLLHPDPAEVFYLGMGTGITASAAMTPHVRRATVCELVLEVITAARTHFGPFTSGLFTDPRTRIVAEDGRTFLGVTDERYDVIVSDLFVPWEARAGSLYSLEHFRAARAHLKPGGIFAQWIPLYQMSRREFSIVARTMLEVFPQVTVWRGDLKVNSPALVLIGQTATQPLDPEIVARRLDETPDPALLTDIGAGAARLLWCYCGNLSAARSLVGDAPLNTDDHPLIEYLAPVTHRRVGAHQARFLTGEEMVALHRDLLKRAPPETDPYLSRIPPAQRGLVWAGFFLHAKAALQFAGKAAEADSMDRALGEVLLQAVRSARPASP